MTTAKEAGTVWLEARGLDPELAVRMGWEASCRNQDGTIWMKIPYIRDGKAVTTQYRRLDTKEFRFQKDSEVELWNVDILKDDTLAEQPLILAEGACDGLALIQCGYPRTVAVPGWSDKNFEPDKYEPFKRNEEEIKRARKVIVAQHADNAGAAMLRGVANFFDECDVRYVTWPKGCKDANDVLLEHGPEAVVLAINGAKQVDPPGGLITGFSDLPPRPERALWKLHWTEFDRLLAFRSREISVLTGTPGAGKTTFMTWLCHQLVNQHELRIGLGLFETDPAEVLDHLFRLNAGCPRGDLLAGKEADIIKKLDRHYRLFHRVEEGEQMHGMAWLKKMVHKLAARDGCNLIVIDPWNELEHLLEPGESVTNYTNFALMRMRQWADRYDIHIVILVHPRKMQDGRAPLGYDIADSAAFANKPGMGWTVHLEEDDKGEHVSLINWKVRSRQGTGCRPGKMKMTFDENAMSYRPR